MYGLETIDVIYLMFLTLLRLGLPILLLVLLAYLAQRVQTLRP